jgi:hypothetical protein
MPQKEQELNEEYAIGPLPEDKLAQLSSYQINYLGQSSRITGILFFRYQ